MVNKLKTDKAVKTEIYEAIKKFITLKDEYKSTTGSEWKPDVAVMIDGIKVTDLESKLREHHNTRRRFTSKYGTDVKGYNVDVGECHEELKKEFVYLKDCYKNTTGRN